MDIRANVRERPQMSQPAAAGTFEDIPGHSRTSYDRPAGKHLQFVTMANEKLRAAVQRAGLDPEQLASVAGVDVKSVGRWLAGRSVPRPRHRARVARALGVSEQELWPETHQQPQDLRREIIGAWREAKPGAPDPLSLIDRASERIDLMDSRLAEILAEPGTLKRLSEKAAAGCQVRVVLPAPDSLWLANTARGSEQSEEDFVGRTAAQREVELAMGYLQPLMGRENVDARLTDEQLSHAIVLCDAEALIAHRLPTAADGSELLLHVRTRAADGVFGYFAGQFDALHAAGRSLEPDPAMYPDPAESPARYQPITESTYRGQLAWLEQEHGPVLGAMQPEGRARKTGRRHPRG
jgi:transcriptional regulator with XRE-family HTH domain